MNKVYLFVLVLLSASFTGCLDDLVIDEIGELGCTDSGALNFVEDALVDDGSCEYLEENPIVFLDLLLGEESPPSFPGIWDEAIFVGSNVFFTISNFVGSENNSWSGGIELGIIDIDAEELRIIDINENGSSSPFNFVSIRDNVYFEANDGIHGTEVWVSDGTESGTYMLKDIQKGSNHSYPSEFFVINDTLFFSAVYEDQGRELFVSDGTELGTMVISDFTPLWNQHSESLGLAGYLFFNHDGDLWISDGTSSGTMYLMELSSSTLVDTFDGFVLDDQIFIITYEGSISGLWSYDPLSNSLTELADLNFNSRNSLEFVRMGSYVYFITYDDLLYRTNGHVSGSSIVFDFSDTSLSTSTVTNLKVEGCNLFMYGGVGSHSLWKSDGTALGTHEWLDFFWFHGYYELFGDSLISYGTLSDSGRIYETMISTNITNDIASPDFYSGNSIDTNILSNSDQIIFLFSHSQVAKYTVGNTTESSTCDYDLSQNQLLEYVEAPSSSGIPSHLSASNNNLFYSLSASGKGVEPWFSDKTYGGTFQIKDINVGSGSSHPMFFKSNGTHTFFTADDGVHGRELWLSDGTSSGTNLLKDVWAGSTQGFSSDPEFQFIGGLTYFKTLSGDLWVTDGTEGGTSSLTDSGPTNIANLFSHNSAVYFSARTSDNGYELWMTDGTIDGTVQIADICSGTCSSTPSNLIAYEDGLAFVADDGVHGREIWFTNGNSSGTNLLADVLVGSNSSSPSNLFVINSDLFFVANDTFHGSELWVAHGILDFEIVKDINIGTNGSNVENLISRDGILYFTANDGISGDELWYSDIIVGDTNILIDISNDSSSPHDLVLVEDLLYFLSDDGIHGIEIWSYNLTSSEGYLFSDLYTGTSTYKYQRDLTSAGDFIFFVGTNGGSYHIWYLDTRFPYDESLTVIVETPVV